MSNFVHLHVHSEYSLLDGLSTVGQLVQKAKEIGSPALGITDHGVCGAIPDFITLCNKEGIKPIPGCEVYMTRDRLKKNEFMSEYREKICLTYKLKKKELQQFISKIKKDPDSFDDLAIELLKDHLMDDTSDLFSLNTELSVEEKIHKFREDIYDYLSYDSYHLVLIAIDNQGLEDLYEIVSDAHINGFYGDPRTDLKFIRSNNLGKHIIATSACLGGWFAHLALSGQIEKAKQFIQECKETFHSFYLEKQATRIPEQVKLNRIIDLLAEETDTPKIITTDVHYANKEDHDLHDILVAASTNKCIHDEDRLKYAHEFWMKTEEEIREIENDEEAILNTRRIADMVDVSLPDKPLFPKFPLEEGQSAKDLLEEKCWQGLFQYALQKPIDLEKYARQLKYELEVIISQGYADYFLIVSDFVQWAKKNNYMVGPGRGSAAGSLVSFVLGITTLDPIEWNLMFERFLNPERAGLPDIDIDFSYESARAVQQYLKEKYGHDKVAQIGTYGTLAPRQACRTVGKALGYDLKTEDEFAKSIPEDPKMTLKKAHELEPAVRRYAELYPDWWNAMVKLEGHVRSAGVHAGGIVISPEKLTKRVPLRLDKEGLVTTQYDMKWIEKLLVKFDILKLDTLDLIKETMKSAGILGKVDINKIDYNDPKIYNEIYNNLNLSGIFQCESKLFQDIIREMKPNSIKDISVIVALGRPGPLDLIPVYIRRKFGLEKVTYPFTELEPILKDTYGVFVYQEQIMMSSVVIGGFTRGQSDMLRKGVAKKDEKVMNRWLDLMIYGSKKYKEMHRELVQKYPKGTELPLIDGKTLWVDYDYEEVPDNIEGGINRGFDLNKLLELKEQWRKFGDYCFNFAHSAAYAILSAQTAWLKAYYPTEFMAALMTISENKKDKNNQPKNVTYMKECEEMGIKILPPDINKSDVKWTPIVTENEKSIRYGLGSIAGISEESVMEIISKRPFTSVEDMISKVDGKKINKSKVIALIKAGCFDFVTPNRNLLIRNYLKLRGEPEYENFPAQTTKRNIIEYEREVLGRSVSIKSRWESIEDGKENVQATGYIIEVKTWNAKKDGKEHARIIIQTQEEEITVLVFNWLWVKHREDLQVANKITVKGTKSNGELLAKTITLVEG